MTIKKMMELIHQHHPHVREAEAKDLLKRISDQFCAETEILKGTFYRDTVAKKRYYALDEDILTVTKVSLDGENIPRIVGNDTRLEDEDTTEDNIG